MMAISIRSLAFGYNPTQDRLLFWAREDNGRSIDLQLTRRLTVRLLNSIALLLNTSSAAAVRAPGELRDDVILLEHQSAVAMEPQSTSGRRRSSSSAPDYPSRVASASTQPPALVTTIRIEIHPETFRITVEAGGSTIRIRVSRAGLHRILATLKSQADRAEWGIKIAASWLEPTPSDVALN